MSSVDIRQALAALALGVLPDDEARAVEAGAREEPELARELRDYRATVAMLERILPREPGPPHALHDVLAEVQRPVRTWRLPAIGLRPLAIGAAMAVVLVGLVSVVATRGGGTGADAEARILAVEGGPVSGTAELHDSDRRDGTIVVRLADVPPPPEGHHYQVWVLRRGAEEMESVGVFWARGDVERTFSLPGSGRFAAVDISVEEDAGDPGHSGRSLAGGAFA